MLSDVIAGELPNLRAEAEAMMTSTCTIRVPGTEDTTDDDTGEVTRTPGATVYSGRCRIRPASGPGGDSAEREAGGAQLFVYDYLISVPFVVATVRERHRVTIDSSPDASLVGAEVEVQQIDRGDHLTARRLRCNEVA